MNIISFLRFLLEGPRWIEKKSEELAQSREKQMEDFRQAVSDGEEAGPYGENGEP